MNKIKLFSFLLLFTVFNFNTTAQNSGSIDTTFNVIDTTENSGLTFNNFVKTAIPQVNGKIIVGGSFTSFNGVITNRIARLNEDGRLDASFQTGLGFNNNVNAIAIQQDGKIIVGGNFTSFNGVSKNRIVRLDVNGALDTSFNIGLGFNYEVFSISIQPDGKIVIGGGFWNYNNNSSNNIARLNSNGTYDTSFSVGTGFGGGGVSSISIQPDGKLIIGGSFTSYKGLNARKIIRLNTDGSDDMTFFHAVNFMGGFNADIRTTVIQPNGKILVGGNFTQFEGNLVNQVARLNNNGTLDTTFIRSSGFNDVQSIIIESNGKILIGGTVSFSNLYFIRVDSNGTSDSNFNTSIGFNNEVSFISQQQDGKLIVCGKFTMPRKYIIRLSGNGIIDFSFNLSKGFDGTVNSMAIQQDGKIIAVGSFTMYNGRVANRVVRMHRDGTIDTTFNIGTGPTMASSSLNSPSIRKVYIQNDGKIILCGLFTFFNNVFKNGIVRLDSNGNIDNTFSLGVNLVGNTTNAEVVISNIVFQPDGKIIIGGSFKTPVGQPNTQSSIVRFLQNGQRDTSFNNGGVGFSNNSNSTQPGSVYDLEIQPDGKILAGGIFYSYNGITKYSLLRLNSNGYLDTTFNFNPQSIVYSIKVLPDSSILVGGNLSYQFNGHYNKQFLKLTKNGLLDMSFNYDAVNSGLSQSPNGTLRDIQPLNDGKIILAADVVGTTSSVLLLNSDGTIDTNFISNPVFSSTGSFSGASIFSIAAQDDNNIIIGGIFSKNGSIIRHGISRLLYYHPIDSVSGVKNICNTTSNTTLIAHSSYTSPIFNWYDSLNGGTLLFTGNSFTTPILNSTTSYYVDVTSGGYTYTPRTTVTVTVGQPISSSQILSECNGFSIIIGNNTYNSTGVYVDTLMTIYGCDSLLTTNLTILNATTGVDTQVACDSLTWIDGNTYTSSTNTPTFTIIGGAATGCDSIVALNLTINNLNASYTYTDNGGGNYTFTNTTTGNFTQTHWAYGDGTTSSFANPTHTFNANGTYVIVLTVNDSTTNTTCMDYYLDTLVVTGVVNPVVCAAGFVMYPDGSNNVTVINSSTGNNLTYFWNFGDGGTSTLQFPSHTYATAGPFYLCLTVNDGASCVDMYCDSIGINGVVFNKQTGFTINIIPPPLVTSINEQNILFSRIIIYPNPTTTEFVIELTTFSPATQLSIVSVEGKTVYTNQALKSSKLIVDAAEWSKGIYMVKITDKQSSKVVKLVKQ